MGWMRVQLRGIPVVRRDKSPASIACSAGACLVPDPRTYNTYLWAADPSVAGLTLDVVHLDSMFIYCLEFEHSLQPSAESL